MLRIANHHVSRITSILLVSEFSVSFGSAYLGALIRAQDYATIFFAEHDTFYITALIFALTTTFSLSALGMYQINFREGIRNTLLRLMPALALTFGLLTFIFYFVPDIYLGRGVISLAILLAGAGIFAGRILIYKSNEAGFLRERILFLGSGTLAKECYELALHNTVHHEYDVLGFIAVDDEECLVPPAAVYPSNEKVSVLAERLNADEVVVAVQNRRGTQFPIQDLLDCKLSGIKVIDAATFFEREACQIRVESLQPGWLVFGNGFDQSFVRRFGKQIFDFVVSFVILAITAPIMLLTILAIFIEDQGPIFYRQERVGKNGLSYMVIKFRSMGINAEKPGTPQWAAANDPRVTRVGKFIRKVRIDELPQILNVLKGDMSFVGPRPERPFFVDQLCKEIPFYNMRHSMKPGITGMAQVRYEYGASVEDSLQKLQYDLYYVKNNSLFLDLLILLETIQVVISGKGAH